VSFLFNSNRILEKGITAQYIGCLINEWEEEICQKKNLINSIIVLVVVWIVCVAASFVSNSPPITANTLSNGWVLGQFAANPDKEIILVDTISNLNYAPPSPYFSIPGMPQNYTLVSFESAKGSSAGFEALFISGDLTGDFKVGDKVTVRFTLNQFIAGMPATMTALPNSSIQHYSSLNALSVNFSPLIIAAILTIVIIIPIIVNRIRSNNQIQLAPPPPPPSPQ
jgi:hypothetical protein